LFGGTIRTVGRPKKEGAGKAVHLGFRGDAALTARIDGIAAAMTEKLGGVEVSRSQVLKLLVINGLAPLEMEYLKQVSGKTPEDSVAVMVNHITKLSRLLSTAAGDADDYEGNVRRALAWSRGPRQRTLDDKKRSRDRTRQMADVAAAAVAAEEAAADD
jgi:hypothetical protein